MFVLHTHMQKHNDDIIKTSYTVLRKIYLSLYWKGLCVRESWIPNRTATHWPPQLLQTYQCVFLVLQGCSTGGPEAQVSAGCCFLYSIISPIFWSPNSSDPQLLNRGSRGPLLPGAVFSTASFLQLSDPQNWLNFLCIELYNSSTSTQSLPISD